jgi:Glu-tRNA(Gln) amidotransferase subunit E-like FAD-binding protein
LLIELPRSARKKGVLLSDETITKVAEAFSVKTMIPEQVGLLVDLFVEEPALGIEEALKKLHVSPVRRDKLELMIAEQLELCDQSRLRSDEAYRKHVVPKIVGEVLKSTNHSISGKGVANRVYALIMKGDD